MLIGNEKSSEKLPINSVACSNAITNTLQTSQYNTDGSQSQGMQPEDEDGTEDQE